WRFLLSLQGASISLWPLFWISNIGAFWGLFLPSSLGTDVVRGVYLSKNISNPELAAASVVVDRMMGLFSLLFLCVTSLLVYSSLFNDSLIYLVLVLVACTLLGAYVAFWDSLPDIIEAKISFFSRNRVGKKIINMHRVFLSYKQYPGALRTSFTFSLILQMIRIFAMYMTARSFNIDIELINFFIIVPITTIVIMVPISIGGLGVREGVFVSFFSIVGLGVDEAFLISGTNSVMVTVIGLLGGVFYLFFKVTPQVKK
ncbi:MAG: flippase-like domain-containing protein, partial [Bacteroidetes bacterium]|nr:flippase-like domain-containing protein [Bacteroidota bacterium]